MPANRVLLFAGIFVGDTDPMPAHFLLHRHEFAAWLDALPADAVCGQRDNGFACPLASYVRERTGSTFVQVGAQRYTTAEFDWFLPAWALEFRRQTDRLGGHSITREQALHALSKVPHDERMKGHVA